MMVNKTHSAGELVRVAQKLLAKELRELGHQSTTKGEKSSTNDLAKTLVAALLMDQKGSKSSGKSRHTAA